MLVRLSACESRLSAIEHPTPQPDPLPVPPPPPAVILRPFSVSIVQAILLSKRDSRTVGKDASFGDSLGVTRAYRRAAVPLSPADALTFTWMHGYETGDANGFTLAGGDATTARSGAGWGDAWIDAALANPRVSDSQFIDWLFNSVATIDMVQQRGEQTVALGAVPIVWTVPPRVAPSMPDYDAVYTEPHNARVRALCDAQGWPCIDLYAAFVANPNWRTELVSEDGTHLTLAGYDLRTTLLVEMIGELKRLAVDTLPAPVPVPVPTPEPPPVPGTLAPLTASRLTLVSQAHVPGNQYVGQNMAVRYVNGERRILTMEYGPSDTPQGREYIGDLVESRETAPGMNGDQHWTLDTVPALTEVRRWKNWTPIARMKAHAAAYPGVWKEAPTYNSGVMPAGFIWDEAHGCLWFSLLPQYSPNALWPAWNAVRLVDGEAGGDVSDVNRCGPFYFKDAKTPDLFKDASSGMIPIPPSRQTAMGGTHILAGHHSANIGSRGAKSIGFWVVNGLPDPMTLGPNAVIWPDAYHLYDTSSSSGKSFPNVRKPNFAKNSMYHGGNSAMDWMMTSGVASFGDREPVGLAVGDAIYVSEEPYVYIDCVTVFMHTGASGGMWVPEIWNGTTWVEPPGWKCSHGDVALSAAENVFYWPKTPYGYCQAADAQHPRGYAAGYRYVRLRRVSAGTSGGSFDAALGTISMVGKVYSPDDNIPLPENVGGYVRPDGKHGVPQYDADHYSPQYVDAMYGGAWVTTDTVEGLAYFGTIGSGGNAYGPLPCYAVDPTTGVPVKYECANLPATDASSESGGIGWSNGPRAEAPARPYFLPFTADALMAAAADPSKRFSDATNPASYTDLYAVFPGLITTDTVTNPRMKNEPWFGTARIVNYFCAHSVIWDARAQQVIVQIPTYNRKNILACFQVR